MSRPILELRHAECEGPGSYGSGLAGLASIHTVRAWREQIPDDPRAFSAILVMGGPMGVSDGATHPWLDDEITFLKRAVAQDVPIWGACLGSQLLATALGATVSAAPIPELGVVDVTLTDDGRRDPVWSAVDGPDFPALQWHFDTFEIPAGATLLASSADCAHQAFRHGPHVGVQFHLEVDAALLDEWLAVAEYRAELVDVLGEDGLKRVIADVARTEDLTRALATTAIRQWYTAIR
ncbi:type 1 glutamine amidotransferase [Gordonia sp. CPCC 205515]|uniref:type 1 glutamine amidotransferase n=1 Tax=Gordonia sp. CPCC 205515 TaxID=3140791 RepID=UPI003AF3D5E5